MRLLLDADATLALRKLSLWTLLLGSQVDLVMTQFAAEHELSSIFSSELEALVKSGRIDLQRIENKPRDNAGYQLFKALQKAGCDKGEAEAIAWAKTQKGARPLFVAVDRRAREKFARAHDVESADLGDLAAILIAREVLPRAVVEAKIIVWDDVAQQQGRPKDWKSVSVSLPARIQRVGL